MTASLLHSDYLIIGGGTAGCILAARLSEDPAVRVTLLEAGPEDRDPWIHIPAGYARLFASGRYDWRHTTEPEPALQQRCIAWPRGRVLGGSGSINGMAYFRGSPHDYDRWAQAGARGWSYTDVLPAFQRIEHWDGPPGDTRGRGGAIPVTEPALSEGGRAFVEACVAAGFPRHRDVNDGPIEGAGPIQANVSQGLRRTTARGYLKPARQRTNLQVLTGATVSRLIYDGRRVVGCAAVRDQTPLEFRVAREVILCAGAIASPHLLMLSGVGDGAALQALGIPVVLDRPAVGQNLQDHLISRAVCRTRPAGTLNEIMANPLRIGLMALNYAARRRGPMAIGAGEASLFARVTPGAEEAEVQLLFINFSLAPGRGYKLARHPGMMINFGQCRPDSRGSLTLRSPEPGDRPVIHANYLDAPTDQRILLEAARLARRIVRTSPLRDLVLEELSPPDLADDAALLDALRGSATTVYHPCGTCRMGADDRAVTDPSLRVNGLTGLRIADASVMPLIPSVNIQPAVMMVAERAVELIRSH